MTKTIVKKKKLRIGRLLFLLLFVAVIGLFLYFLATTKIKNIIIKGNKLLSDEEIMKIAQIETYPEFFLTWNSQIKERLEKSPLIENVSIKKDFHNTVKIKVKEQELLIKKEQTAKYVTAKNEEVEYKKNLRVPTLKNEVPEKKFKSLIINLKTVNKDILGQIAEIKYVPNEYDKDRFLLYMNDGNSVYLTLTKFEMINYYHKVLVQLEGRKGILYLDSGNHFKIME